MSWFVYAGVILAVLLLAVSVGWRFWSRSGSHPCPSWLGWLVELDNPLARNHNAQHIIERLGLQPEMKVLDAGCGPGRVTVPLGRALGPGGEVVALDIQPEMLERARRKAEAAGVSNITFQQAALGSGTLAGNVFDRAVLVTVLGEIPDRQSAMAEIYHALKPGGLLSVTEMIFDPHFQGRETVRLLAAPAGFRETAFFGNRCVYTVHFQKPAGR